MAMQLHQDGALSFCSAPGAETSFTDFQVTKALDQEKEG
jgi:hypothetical protein